MQTEHEPERHFYLQARENYIKALELQEKNKQIVRDAKATGAGDLRMRELLLKGANELVDAAEDELMRRINAIKYRERTTTDRAVLDARLAKIMANRYQGAPNV
jgi:hypothetical protein